MRSKVVISDDTIVDYGQRIDPVQDQILRDLSTECFDSDEQYVRRSYPCVGLVACHGSMNVTLTSPELVHPTDESDDHREQSRLKMS